MQRPSQQHLLLHIYCQKCARRKIPTLSFHFHPTRRHCTRAVCHGLLKFCRASRPGVLLANGPDGQIRAAFLLFHPVSPRSLPPPRPSPSFPWRKEGGFKAEALSPLFHGVTTHPSSLLRPPDTHNCRAQTRAYIPPRSFLLTLAFSRTVPPSPFSPQSEDQLEWLGVLRVPAIIPRQSLISTRPRHLHPAGTYDPCRVNTHAFRQSRCLT